jgi:hypothetical protein
MPGYGPGIAGHFGCIRVPHEHPTDATDLAGLGLVWLLSGKFGAKDIHSDLSHSEFIRKVQAGCWFERSLPGRAGFEIPAER